MYNPVAFSIFTMLYNSYFYFQMFLSSPKEISFPLRSHSPLFLLPYALALIFLSLRDLPMLNILYEQNHKM